MPKTYVSECRDSVPSTSEGHLVPRVLAAEIHLGTLQHEPVQTVGVATESEHDDHTLVRQRVHAHHPPQRPHEEVGIEALVLEVFARPIVAPRSECIDHWRERPAGVSQAIMVSAFTVGLDLLDDSAAAQRLESQRKEDFLRSAERRDGCR